MCYGGHPTQKFVMKDLTTRKVFLTARRRWDQIITAAFNTTTRLSEVSVSTTALLSIGESVSPKQNGPDKTSGCYARQNAKRSSPEPKMQPLLDASLLLGFSY